MHKKLGVLRLRRRLGTSLGRACLSSRPRSVSPGEAKHESLGSWHGRGSELLYITCTYSYRRLHQSATPVGYTSRLLGTMAATVSLSVCGVTVERRWCTENTIPGRCSRVCCGQRRVAQGSGVVEGRRPLVGGEFGCWLRPGGLAHCWTWMII